MLLVGSGVSVAPPMAGRSHGPVGTVWAVEER